MPTLRVASCGRVITYHLPDESGLLVVSARVLVHFNQYRQLGPGTAEAGGQLFARFEHTNVIIELADGPDPKDERTRTSFRPYRPSERKRIRARHKEGLHFVGDWHTHPQDLPIPSALDRESMNAMFSHSQHSLNHFYMVVVGRRPFPHGLHVSACDADNCVELAAIDLSESNNF